MAKTLCARAGAALALAPIIREQGSLSGSLPLALQQVKPSEKALCAELSYGAARWFIRYEATLDGYLSKPFRDRDYDIYALLVIGAYQLFQMRTPDHAAISTVVEATRTLNKRWASKLVNGVLRRLQREWKTDHITADLERQYAHPEWLVKRVQEDWPKQWRDILRANNEYPPMALRYHVQGYTREDALADLAAADIAASAHTLVPTAINLEKAVDVETIPEFSSGSFSVQDPAAQLAAHLLQLEASSEETPLRVLDACCAPGGKTAHILETAPSALVTAIDADGSRMTRVMENLERIDASAELLEADAGELEQWWEDGEPFDRILLDAPCSATGVIRRHPDIKLLRSEDDVKALAQTQQRLLENLWTTLKPGGILLYATCSILNQENDQQIKRFLATTDDAELLALDDAQHPWGEATDYGRRIAVGQDGMDGFYYARLQKKQAP